MNSGENLGYVTSNNDYIFRHFSDKEQYLNIGHINVQSIKPSVRTSKFEEFANILQGNFLDVVGITETWLKSWVDNNAVQLPGYKLYRVDRQDDIRAGGVAFYVSDSLSVKVILEFSNPNSVECLFLEIMGVDSKVLFGIAYLHKGNISGIHDLDNILGDITCRYEHIILMGDFNHNLFDSIKSAIIS